MRSRRRRAARRDRARHLRRGGRSSRRRPAGRRVAGRREPRRPRLSRRAADPQYLDDLRAGYIIPDAEPQVIRETPASALVDGGWTFGEISASFAAEQVVERAKATGLAAVGLVRANHIGRLGEWASKAAGQGVVALVTAGGFGGRGAAPFGGRAVAFGTNPMALAFPARTRARRGRPSRPRRLRDDGGRRGEDPLRRGEGRAAPARLDRRPRRQPDDRPRGVLRGRDAPPLRRAQGLRAGRGDRAARTGADRVRRLRRGGPGRPCLRSERRAVRRPLRRPVPDRSASTPRTPRPSSRRCGRSRPRPALPRCCCPAIPSGGRARRGFARACRSRIRPGRPSSRRDGRSV